MAFIALVGQDCNVTLDGIKNRVVTPPGCIGIFLAFETKEKALEWFGNTDYKIEFVEIEIFNKGGLINAASP